MTLAQIELAAAWSAKEAAEVAAQRKQNAIDAFALLMDETIKPLLIDRICSAENVDRSEIESCLRMPGASKRTAIGSARRDFLARLTIDIDVVVNVLFGARKAEDSSYQVDLGTRAFRHVPSGAGYGSLGKAIIEARARAKRNLEHSKTLGENERRAEEKKARVLQDQEKARDEAEAQREKDHDAAMELAKTLKADPLLMGVARLMIEIQQERRGYFEAVQYAECGYTRDEMRIAE